VAESRRDVVPISGGRVRANRAKRQYVYPTVRGPSMPTAHASKEAWPTRVVYDRLPGLRGPSGR
jgi:hypothetical protein